jgi:small-conductance mechanosensitive channel
MVHAEQCASAIREGLRIELRRRAVANVVFSASVVVLSGLLSFLLLGAVSRGSRRIADLVEARADLPGWRLGSIEVLTPAAVRVAASTAISIAKPIVQVTILASWLLFALSLVPATASIGARLTGFLLTPATTFFARIGAALPVLVVLIIGGFALAILLRFLRVFFESVQQGGIHLRWLSREKAVPASLVARVATVICALLAAAPLMSTETEWSVLRIGGFAITVAVMLASTPALANVAAGTLLLFDGRIKVGGFIEIGTCSGRLTALTLTELRIEDRSGAEIRVPHLLTVLRPLKLFGEMRPSSYEIVVDARAPQGKVRKALANAVSRQGRTSWLELVQIEGDVAWYRVVGAVTPGEDDLGSAIADALTREGLAFTRIRRLDVE